jgi:hypothetical protein
VIQPERLPRVRSRQSWQRLWARRVRGRILANLSRYPTLSAIVAALLLPGGFVFVPVIAWWHRRSRKSKPARHS